MECVWEVGRRLAQPCQHPHTEEQLIVLPPDQTYVQGLASKIPLQMKMISEGKLRHRQRKQTKMVVENLTVMGRLRQQQDYIYIYIYV